MMPKLNLNNCSPWFQKLMKSMTKTTPNDAQLAKKALARHKCSDTITFRGLTLDHFNAEELRKIVEITMSQCEERVLFYQKAIDDHRKFYDTLTHKEN
jgi:hypothetical protein